MIASGLYASYIEAFQRAYPQKSVILKSKEVSSGVRGTLVIIDGDLGGGLLVTDDDLRFAIHLFNQGRSK